MAGLLTTPQVNVKGALSLINQIYDKNITLVNQSSLANLNLIAQMLTGITSEQEALCIALKNYPGFLKHFFYSFAIPCAERDLEKILGQFPTDLMCKKFPDRGAYLILVTANLEQWIHFVKFTNNNTTERLKDTFTSIGLGRFFR